MNLLQYNDDDNDTGTHEFKLSLWLQTMTNYVVVVTTYSTKTTAPFSILVEGPTAVNLSSTNATG